MADRRRYFPFIMPCPIMPPMPADIFFMQSFMRSCSFCIRSFIAGSVMADIMLLISFTLLFGINILERRSRRFDEKETA